MKCYYMLQHLQELSGMSSYIVPEYQLIPEPTTMLVEDKKSFQANMVTAAGKGNEPIKAELRNFKGL